METKKASPLKHVLLHVALVPGVQASAIDCSKITI